VVVVVPVSSGTTKDLTIKDKSIKVGSVDKKLCSIISVKLKCVGGCSPLDKLSIKHSCGKFDDCDNVVQEKALAIMKPLCGFR